MLTNRYLATGGSSVLKISGPQALMVELSDSMVITNEEEEATINVYQTIQNMDDILLGFRVALLYLELSINFLFKPLFMTTMFHVLSVMSPLEQLY